jgi:hypothetical protein
VATPLCAACTRPDPSFWNGCPICGYRQLSTRFCTRCNLRQRLRVLLADHHGDVPAELRGLHDNLAGSERPNLAMAWLNKTVITSGYGREFEHQMVASFGTSSRT